jgi:hypothetical protein
MNHTNLIKCNTLAEFLDVIEGLVRRGLIFTANASDLEISLTGGY